MASLGGRWIAAVIFGLLFIWPFVLLESLLCFLLGILVGGLYSLTCCVFGAKSKEVQAKGCWLFREALLYAVAGICLCFPFMVLVPFKPMTTNNWRFGCIPTFLGWIDVNRFLAYRYLSFPAITGAGSFTGNFAIAFDLFRLSMFLFRTK
jgi:hypothetical protein